MEVKDREEVGTSSLNMKTVSDTSGIFSSHVNCLIDKRIFYCFVFLQSASDQYCLRAPIHNNHSAVRHVIETCSSLPCLI